MAAKVAASGVPFETPEGRADFHALRHSFISNLVRAGVSPKVAQQLARHSTITLTMDRYAHTAIGDLRAGVTCPPRFSLRCRRGDADTASTPFRNQPFTAIGENANGMRGQS